MVKLSCFNTYISCEVYLKSTFLYTTSPLLLSGKIPVDLIEFMASLCSITRRKYAVDILAFTMLVRLESILSILAKHWSKEIITTTTSPPTRHELLLSSSQQVFHDYKSLYKQASDNAVRFWKYKSTELFMLVVQLEVNNREEKSNRSVDD